MDNKYDILIIGSGLGGLMSGALLSRFGRKVLILEKNHQIGGSLQSFNFGSCDFSTGLHYLGGLDTGQNLHKIFKYFGILNKVRFQQLDKDGFDIFNIDDKEYRFPVGWENFSQAMIGYFPDEVKAIKTYVRKIIEVIKNQHIYNLQPPREDKSAMDPSLSINTWDYLCSITKNKRLRNVLTALNFVYAGEKNKSPLYVHALINNHYISGSYRVIGPTSQIATVLADQVLENGGKVLTNEEVIKLNIESDKVKSVRTKNGNLYNANHIISDVHPATTMKLIADGDIKKSFRKRMDRKKNTLSAFAVHLVLKEGAFKYRNYNYNFYKGDDVWYASKYNSLSWPEHYMLHCKVPVDGSEFSRCVGLLTHMSFDEVEKWASFSVDDRGKDYSDFKKQKAEQLISLACDKFPELKNNIVRYNVSTPLTYESYLGTPEGSMYGTVRDFMNPMGSYISPQTKLGNLYFTGQNLNLHGIMGVSLSSIITCGEFLGLNNILNELNPDES